MGSRVATAASTATASVTSITVAWPAGIQAGDYAILNWALSSGQTSSSDGGLTLLNQADDSGLRSRVLTKVCTGTETGSITLTTTPGGARMCATLAIYRGYTGVLVSASTTDATTSTSHTAPALTYSGLATLISLTSERITSGSTTATAPTGWTKEVEFGTSGTGGTFCAIGDNAVATPIAQPGAWGSWTHNVAAADSVVWSLALTPSSSGPGGSFLPFL